MRPVAALGAAMLLAAGLAVRAAPAATLEYLHVAAGEGNSAGGHAAIRFGASVYHFQHRAPGLLVPARTDAGTFFWHYGVRENRTIRRAAVTVDDSTWTRLRDRFNTRYLVERRAAAVLETLRRDRALLAAWRDGDAGAVVAEASPFAPDAGPAPVLVELRARVAARLQPDTLAARADRQRAAIARLPLAALVGPVAVDARGVADPGYRLSERWADLAARLLALEVLASARPVRPEALVGDDQVAPLGDGERTRLAAFRAGLLERLVRLVDSSRPDWGGPLLAGMARLQAIDASLASGRLLVVADGPGVVGAGVRARDDARAYAAEVAAAGRNRLRDLRLAALGEHTLDEQTYARLERALREIAASQAVATGFSQPNGAPSQRVAAASDGARLRVAPPPLDAATLARALERAAASEAEYERGLVERLGYGLLDHNCVTEIFRTIDRELTPAESTALLGGHVEASVGIGVVPARSFEVVRRTWAGARISESPSYRTRRLAEMCRAEPDAVVRLRESNVLTSTLYRPTDDDSAFLFFTDDAGLARPLYGLANLAYGTAAAGLGLVTLPLDRGRRLGRGARGVVASVPELGFVSIRKGRMLRGPERDGE